MLTLTGFVESSVAMPKSTRKPQGAGGRRPFQEHLVRRGADVPGHRLAGHQPGERTADALTADQVVPVHVGGSEADDREHALEGARRDAYLGDPLVVTIALPVAVVIEEDETLDEELGDHGPHQTEISTEEAGERAVVEAHDQDLKLRGSRGPAALGNRHGDGVETVLGEIEAVTTVLVGDGDVH